MIKKNKVKILAPAILLIAGVIVVLNIYYHKDKKLKHYPQGQIKQEYYLNRDGEVDGRLVEYFKEGNVSSIIYFKEGKQDGWAQFFREDGTLRKKTYFENGIQHDTLLTFFNNGDLESAFSIKKGKKDGRYTYYHKNGKIKESGFYKNDKIEGRVLVNDIEGQLLAQGFYDSGNHYALIRRIGEQQEFISYSAKFKLTIPKDFELDSINSNSLSILKNKEDGINLMIGANASSLSLKDEVELQIKDVRANNNIKIISSKDCVIGGEPAILVELQNNNSNDFMKLFFLKVDGALVNIFFIIPKLSQENNSLLIDRIVNSLVAFEQP